MAPPTTVELHDDLPEPRWGAALPSAPAAADPLAAPVDNRPCAYLAVAGATLAAIGAFQVWLRISVAGLNPPGSAETGWAGGDGRSVVGAALVAGLAGGALLLQRRDVWLKIALLIAGGVTFVIALVHMVNAGSKAHDIQVQFGIPSGDVRAQIGAGLYMAMAGGAAILAAGLRARTHPA
ncbi:MAG TPA: hypothetical protein VGZ52_03930 [Acidimicrobiales bacterium]|nr:hypothetical protein [Acidimicrobiales bacterium]